MNVFRRLRPADAPRALLPSTQSAGDQVTTGLIPRPDTGPILVAVDGHAAGWKALEWAAAEAAARTCSLRIVHAINWAPLIWDAFGGVYANERDAGADAAGEVVLGEARRRASVVAPGLAITTELREGEAARVILREAQEDSLIVLGRGRKRARLRRLTESVGARVARGARCPVAVVELLDAMAYGPSAGRVVVGIDGTPESVVALGFAFRAAQRRGVGITAVHAWTRREFARLDAWLDDSAAAESLKGTRIAQALQQCQDTFPEVGVRQRLIVGPAGPALVAESSAAALLVVGSRARPPVRGVTLRAVARHVVRGSRSPVAVVRTSG
jgi:nucleotide-binding universal stress UspA family protein